MRPVRSTHHGTHQVSQPHEGEHDGWMVMQPEAEPAKRREHHLSEKSMRKEMLATQCQRANLGRLMSMYYLNSFGHADRFY